MEILYEPATIRLRRTIDCLPPQCRNRRSRLEYAV